jgi:hypothetical protein
LTTRNKYSLLWLGAGLVLLGVLVFAYQGSPFVNATGPFAGFEKARAIPAGLIGIGGTLAVTVWGWLLLRSGRRGKKDEQ